MPQVLNTDLVLTSRKDTRRFVLELCTNICKFRDLQTNIRIQYVTLLESYVYYHFDSYPSLDVDFDVFMIVS